MAYNVTAVGNTTGILDFIGKIDNYIFCVPGSCGGEGGLLGLTILIIIFGVLMMNFVASGREFNSSVMATSFICLIIGALFFLMEIVTPVALYICLLVWGISVAIGSRK